MWVAAAQLMAALTILGCSETKSPGSDGGPRDPKDASAGESGSGGSAGSPSDAGDAGADSDGGAATSCNPAITKVVSWKDSVPVASTPVYAWTGNHVVAAWGLSGGGYRVLDLDPTGATPALFKTLWPDERVSGENTRVAVSNGVLAIVEGTTDAATEHRVCRLALVRVDGLEPMQPPTRFSDLPEQATLLNQAPECAIAPLGDGFVLLWQQYSNPSDSSATLFAQRIRSDGTSRGDRLTLHEALPKPLPIETASNGEHVVVAAATARDAKDMSLWRIGQDSLETSALSLEAGGKKAASVKLRAAHDGYIAVALDSVWLLDAKGQPSTGPVSIPNVSQAFIAPMGDGYVVVEHDEFLTATARDEKFGAPSKPVGFSDDRGASASAILSDADGDHTFVVFYEQGSYRLATLGCGDEPPDPPGPTTCPKPDSFSPLDDGCTDPVCHVVMRFDYLTLGLRGWAAVGGALRTVTESEAKSIAAEAIGAHEEYARDNVQIIGQNAGLYYAYANPADFGAFALIGAQSGAVVVGGGVVWSGQGKLWAPASWNDPSDLACGDKAVKPAASFSGDEVCIDHSDLSMKHASIEEALDTGLRTNLAASVAARGVFDAYAYLYTPTVGSCDPRTAEYLVVLTQQR
jgi:hypothetical protein